MTRSGDLTAAQLPAVGPPTSGRSSRTAVGEVQIAAPGPHSTGTSHEAAGPRRPASRGGRAPLLKWAASFSSSTARASGRQTWYVSHEAMPLADKPLTLVMAPATVEADLKAGGPPLIPILSLVKRISNARSRLPLRVVPPGQAGHSSWDLVSPRCQFPKLSPGSKSPGRLVGSRAALTAADKSIRVVHFLRDRQPQVILKPRLGSQISRLCLDGRLKNEEDSRRAYR
jgi:hypothetical protein